MRRTSFVTGVIVGNYTQLAMFQNTLGALLEPGVEGLPDEGP